MKSSIPPSPRLQSLTSSTPLCWIFPLPFCSLLCPYSLTVSQVVARAGCVYCWGNWSSLESLTLSLLRPKICACTCVRVYSCAYACLWWLAVRERKQALARVSPLGKRQIGFHYAVCLFLSHFLQLSFSYFFTSLDKLKDNLSCFSSTLYSLYSTFSLSWTLLFHLLMFLSLIIISSFWPKLLARFHRWWLFQKMSRSSPLVVAINMSRFVPSSPGSCSTFSLAWLGKGLKLDCKVSLNKDAFICFLLSFKHTCITNY